MCAKPISKIVIVGGGTAGWMTAAPLIQHLEKHAQIVLIESAEIGTIGVGEATLPTIRAYNHWLGINSEDFIKKTQATFKLGIEFKDWGHIGNRFFHGFGDFGPKIENISPHMHWLRMQQADSNMPSYEHWSVPTVMARNMRFVPPAGGPPSANNSYTFGYQFDAGLYAAYLRDYAMQRGVTRIEATVAEVELRPEDGFIAAVKLSDGRRIDGDLFIDCSGFRGLLIEGAMKAGYDDWSAQLPCNSALAVPCAKVPKLTPFTTSTAKSAGWLWRIPLQHRTGNGHVYCNSFTTDDEAARVLLAGLDGRALDEPRQLRFTTGRRRKSWIKNCVAIGLSSGFVEPLESTSIGLIEIMVLFLVENFPDCDFRPELANEFNRRISIRYESIRDFIIMHYKLNNRSDSEFWRYCANMAIPDTLRHQIELFRETGRVAIYDRESFSEESHVAMLLGLGVRPKTYDPFIDKLSLNQLHGHFSQIGEMIAGAVKAMPDHTDYIARYAASAPVPGLAV